jgi:hypothetical protein
MGKFLCYSELYETIQRLSSQAKEILWVSSFGLGTNAHAILSLEILKNPPKDIRFVFPLNDKTVEHSEINPYEIQYLREHFKDRVKAYDKVHSNIFIFDDSALITSSELTETAFSSSINVGVLIEDSEVEKIKTFFAQNLWENAKSIGDLRNHKKIWSLNLKNEAKKVISRSKLVKEHTNILGWSDEYANKWYIGVLNRFPDKTDNKIRKETNWGSELVIVGDVGYNAYRELKLGDLTYIADLNRQRGKILIQSVRLYDKIRFETDEGDLHFACQVLNNFILERNQFYDLLKNINLRPRTYEAKLNPEQLKLLSETLSNIKQKRRKIKSKPSKKTNNKKARIKR